MSSQKIENLLNLALDTPQEQREKSQNLNVGYDEESNTWDVIVRYHGQIESLEQVDDRIQVVPLLNGYAVLTLPQQLIDVIADLEEIEYMEKPKRLYFELSQARSAACVNAVQEGETALSGAGTIVAVIDSGIDFRHEDFRYADGTTRILALWDQTISGAPPAGYRIGTEYSREQINELLQEPSGALPQILVPGMDSSGHGTHVAGIAAGNGRASSGRYRGVAPEASLLVVKLGVPRSNSFPRTTELIQAVDYVIKKALGLSMPVAINISFGNTYGAHNGSSLLETYLDQASGVWKNVIAVGTGNEGATAGHASGTIVQGKQEQVSFAVSNYETTVNIQIWKNYADIFRFRLLTPSGESVELFLRSGEQQFVLGNTRVLLYYGQPSPYNVLQEIYMDLIPMNTYIDGGIWAVLIEGEKVVDGQFEMWLPSVAALNSQTEFLYPSEQLTLTIPSTSANVISVAAYNSRTNTYADFSGRGYTGRAFSKPDLAAPGVDIMSTAAGGGYTVKSGTSMATPFVTGAAALLMQYGIVQGKDPYLYGEKVKAYLVRGARQLPVLPAYPNALLGWGVLCLRDSLPE